MNFKNTLLIVDGHNLLFRSYAIPFKFSSKKGIPLHVCMVFLSLLRRVINASHCSHVIVVFDAEGQTTNHVLSETYKANRKTDYLHDEDSPFHHLPHIAKILKYLKVKTIEKVGVEADDVIGSLARQYVDEVNKSNVYIASTDSDFYQLLSRKITQIVFGKKGVNIFLTPRSISEKLGIKVSQYVYFKSLKGDKTDNIKGIPGIGPVRAQQIINKTLMVELGQFQDCIELNKKLIQINTGLKLLKSWNPARLNRRIFKLKNSEIFDKVGL